jgi:uncharacterized protein (TIGR03067 family)
MYWFRYRAYLVVMAMTAIGRSICADDTADTIDETLLAKLQGEWRTVSSVFDGKPFISPAGEWRAIFSGRTMSLKSGDKEIGRLEIKHVVAHEELGHMDYEMVDPTGKAVRTKQLFKLDGDTLTTCVYSPPGERPSELTSEAGSHRLLTVLHRAKTDVSNGDKELLQGLWQAVSLEASGKQASAEEVKEFQLLFRGDNVVFVPKHDNREHTFDIDPKAKPKAMDITPGDGQKKGQKMPCAIYDLTGDKLIICIDKEGTYGKRPTEFKTEAGDGLGLLTLVKVKQPK